MTNDQDRVLAELSAEAREELLREARELNIPPDDPVWKIILIIRKHDATVLASGKEMAAEARALLSEAVKIRTILTEMPNAVGEKLGLVGDRLAQKLTDGLSDELRRVAKEVGAFNGALATHVKAMEGVVTTAGTNTGKVTMEMKSILEQVTNTSTAVTQKITRLEKLNTRNDTISALWVFAGALIVGLALGWCFGAKANRLDILERDGFQVSVSQTKGVSRLELKCPPQTRTEQNGETLTLTYYAK